jgi:hypothetical protein
MNEEIDKFLKTNQVWWFMPVIPAIWEVEVRRVAVQVQAEKNVSETLSQPIS